MEMVSEEEENSMCKVIKFLFDIGLILHLMSAQGFNPITMNSVFKTLLKLFDPGEGNRSPSFKKLSGELEKFKSFPFTKFKINILRKHVST